MQWCKFQIATHFVFVSSIAVLAVLLSQQNNDIHELKAAMKQQQNSLQIHHDDTDFTDYMESRHLTIFDGEDTSASVPKARTRASPTSRVVYVTGLVGDGIADDTKPIRKALARAADGTKDAIVVLPKGTFLTTSTLKVKAGVKLVGQGYGPSPLALDNDKGGSTIAYCGDGYAVKFSGHSAALESVAVTDWNVGANCAAAKAEGGILIRSNATLIESVGIRDVLLYQFTDGTALLMEAILNSGISYANFNNLIITGAKKGIHLKADATSFVSSNNFNNGVISGGIAEVAVHAEGPGACNGNNFNGVGIEPPITSIAHVYVSGSLTNVRMNNVRLEGSGMPADKPLVIIDDASYGNVMNGVLENTFVQADLNRNPGITFLTRKFTAVEPPPANLLYNAAFHNLNSTIGDMPGWSRPGATDDIVVTYDSAVDLYADHRVIQITVGSAQSGSYIMIPNDILKTTRQTFYTWGVWANTDVKGAIAATLQDTNSKYISSAAHTGSGKWEFIGLTGEYLLQYDPQPRFTITGNVKITAPSFTFGYRPAAPGAEFLSSARAKMAGRFVTSNVQVDAPSTTNFLTLPLTGNVFDILPVAAVSGTNCQTSYFDVKYVNVRFSSGWFEKGTVITIMLPACGGCIPCLRFLNNDYLSLVGGTDFMPTTAHTSLTLISNGNGSWREVSRNA